MEVERLASVNTSVSVYEFAEPELQVIHPI